MSTCGQRSSSVSKIFFSYYKSSFQTKCFSSTKVFERTTNKCVNHLNKFEKSGSELTRTGDIINLQEKMPVITAVAVAAHRQNHHPTPKSHCIHPHPLHKRFSLLTFSSSHAEAQGRNVVVRSKSFGCPGMESEFTRGLLDVNQQRIASMPYNKEIRRFYAKGKDKPKSKKSVVTINEAEMAEIINVGSFKDQLEKLLEQMKDEFSKQLSIRGAAGALETLKVEFEGETYPLHELAQVGRKNPQLAVLNLSSLPDACQAVVKAIQDSGMNLNPQQEGTTIYIPLPKVTREHRENLSKNAKIIFNKYKTSFQAVQNKYVKQCKSQTEGISEDLAFNVQQQIMKLAESHIAEAEKLLQSKQKELLENK